MAYETNMHRDSYVLLATYALVSYVVMSSAWLRTIIEFRWRRMDKTRNRSIRIPLLNNIVITRIVRLGLDLRRLWNASFRPRIKFGKLHRFLSHQDDEITCP